MIKLFLTEDGVFAESIAESVASAAISMHTPNTYYLWTLFVKKNHRNRGFATKLLTEICRIVDSQGCDIWLDLAPRPDTDYTRLEKLYESFGFVKQPNRYFRTRRNIARKNSAQGSAASVLDAPSYAEVKRDEFEEAA